MKTKSKGFTLVELVITIAIVIILAVVSVPIYNSYTWKAKYAEGYALLGTIFSAQKAYYSEYGNFLSGSNGSAKANMFTCNDLVFGIDARGNKYFTSFRLGNNDDLTKRFSAWVVKPEELRSSINKSCLQMSFDIENGKGALFYDNVDWNEIAYGSSGD